MVLAAAGGKCCLKGEKWIQSVGFSKQNGSLLIFHRGKWETGVLGVFTSHFCAERIQPQMPLSDSS